MRGTVGRRSPEDWLTHLQVYPYPRGNRFLGQQIVESGGGECMKPIADGSATGPPPFPDLRFECERNGGPGKGGVTLDP